MNGAPIFKPADFFAFRTALFPFHLFQDWSLNLNSPEAAEADLDAALASDEAILRQRLQEILRDPVLLEALFLASPDLVDALHHWYKDPHTAKGRRVERTVVKYFSRLCGRSTPFGLFAGCSIGRLGQRTEIATLSRNEYIRHTRPDMDYLCNLASVLSANDSIINTIKYTPNTSIYYAAGRLHYYEVRGQHKQRSYHLVAVDPTDYLIELLARAAKGISFENLVASLIDEEITQEDAKSFVRELIQSQILVPDLEPTITGPEPLHAMIVTLEGLPYEGARTAAKILAHMRDELASIDASPLGLPIDRYLSIAERLRDLPVPVEMNRLFQTDLVKPAPEAEVGGEVMEEVQTVMETLWCLPGRSVDTLKEFKQAFQERYEDREVPLAEVLDEESGIRFGAGSERGVEDSPLLAGLPFGGGGGESRVNWGPWENWLYQRLLDHHASGNAVLTLSREDLEPFLKNIPEQIPNAFSVIVRVAAKNQKALDEGRFHLYLAGGSGPSGMELLGRFCHSNPDLEDHVKGFLCQEVASRPGVIHAEVVHLPEGRIGNVILRPSLREYDIPFLGRSGLDEEHQILLSDLLVSVQGDRVVLRSHRLAREVVPHLTCAHNFQGRNLRVYRFLGMLQYQNPSGSMGWNWGPINSLPFLPRVVLGRTVLSKSRWLVKIEEVKAVLESRSSSRINQLRKWIVQRKLPNLVLLVEGDNKLPIDFNNALSVDVFLDTIKERPSFVLEEFYPDPTELGAFSPEGSFVHEVILPFHVIREPRNQPPKSFAPPLLARTYPPGSEWLYAKIYTGLAGADTLLRGPILSLVKDTLDHGASDGWFFIRYSDPEHHLRLRFHGDPARLCAEVMPQLLDVLSPYLASGMVSKMMLDTYDQEIERYGGEIGMPLCEAIFRADSEMALSMFNQFRGDEFADQRWRLTLASTDRLLRDFGYELPDRLQLATIIRDQYRKELNVEGKREHPYGKRFRQERKEIEALVWNPWDSALKDAIPILDARSQAIVKPVSSLRAAFANSGNSRLDPLVMNLIHMTSNRLLRAAQRPQELAIADFLVRTYKSRMERVEK